MNALDWSKRSWSWLNRQNAISGFFVTMLGVLAALWLAGLIEQRSRNDATRQRLQLVHFEAEQNAILAQAMFQNESSTNRADFILKRPQSVAISAALADDNLPAFLRHAKLSMLLTYLESIEALRNTLDTHSAHLVNVGFRREEDHQFLRKAIQERSATTLAACFAVLSDLDPYASPSDWDPQLRPSNQERIDSLAEMARQGRLIMTNDPTVRKKMRGLIQNGQD